MRTLVKMSCFALIGLAGACAKDKAAESRRSTDIGGKPDTQVSGNEDETAIDADSQHRMQNPYSSGATPAKDDGMGLTSTDCHGTQNVSIVISGSNVNLQNIDFNNCTNQGPAPQPQAQPQPVIPTHLASGIFCSNFGFYTQGSWQGKAYVADGGGNYCALINQDFNCRDEVRGGGVRVHPLYTSVKAIPSAEHYMGQCRLPEGNFCADPVRFPDPNSFGFATLYYAGNDGLYCRREASSQACAGLQGRGQNPFYYIPDSMKSSGDCDGSKASAGPSPSSSGGVCWGAGGPTLANHFFRQRDTAIACAKKLGREAKRFATFGAVDCSTAVSHMESSTKNCQNNVKTPSSQSWIPGTVGHP